MCRAGFLWSEDLAFTKHRKRFFQSSQSASQHRLQAPRRQFFVALPLVDHVRAQTLWFREWSWQAPALNFMITQRFRLQRGGLHSLQPEAPPPPPNSVSLRKNGFLRFQRCRELILVCLGLPHKPCGLDPAGLQENGGAPRTKSDNRWKDVPASVKNASHLFTRHFKSNDITRCVRDSGSSITMDKKSEWKTQAPSLTNSEAWIMKHHEGNSVLKMFTFSQRPSVKNIVAPATAAALFWD